MEHRVNHLSLNNPPVTGFPIRPCVFPWYFNLFHPETVWSRIANFIPLLLPLFSLFSLFLYNFSLSPLFIFFHISTGPHLCSVGSFAEKFSFPAKPFSARSSACECLASLFSLPQAATKALPPTFFSPPTFYSFTIFSSIIKSVTPSQCGSLQASYERSSSPFLLRGRR